ncbi:hypothetical protein OUZ56_030436 [Daphnia magna]|uniref:Uncharacterized protein n=1 Tax=Daphnia magna TaxID=35525 RepID=A0ABQ9ZRQ2_9CRUS|nr:hypothetical protein OUZ56_030436 [Daphnia magna]
MCVMEKLLIGVTHCAYEMLMLALQFSFLMHMSGLNLVCPIGVAFRIKILKCWRAGNQGASGRTDCVKLQCHSIICSLVVLLMEQP